jgi:hypothetical protein
VQKDKCLSVFIFPSAAFTSPEWLVKKILLFSFNTVKKIEQEIFMGFIIVMCVAIWGLKIIFSGD